MTATDLHGAWLAAMRRGDFEAAWAVNAAVLAAHDPATRDDPRLPYHLRWVWDGRSFAGRHVLVRCYHGLGDTLQFARFLPALAARAASVSLECQPALVPLLSRMPGLARVIAFDVAAPVPPSECDIEVMELGFALRLRPEACPPPTLAGPPAAALPPGTLGLCWQVGDWDKAREVPPALLSRLAEARPCVSLVPGRAPLPCLNPDGCPPGIAETAALVAGVARVVTVDTMVAHLAGALARPVTLLLKHDADWRWMADGAASPWYPTMRIHRQPEPGRWAPVLAAVEADLLSETG
ncbi:hypothetical protein P7D22_05205 [Lichenihabitans sp. Uapishka_5]|uniref:hypothetical protein n=1 Tax=Lichenihabitans sp. Uapishka_5 TaxID=3037302 RepID=UPI0029E7E353|nr:hypothetical protein [Lichenihabitans sp. Uapishka_5]MDX7950575.1 hypothetical protein [Lichenihabitans sp. Uapishka_5]